MKRARRMAALIGPGMNEDCSDRSRRSPAPRLQAHRADQKEYAGLNLCRRNREDLVSFVLTTSGLVVSRATGGVGQTSHFFTQQIAPDSIKSCRGGWHSS